LRESVTAFGQLEVEGHRTLVAVEILHVEPVARPAHVFVGIHTRRRLDLDHVGAEVGELLLAGGAGAHARQIQNPVFRKRGRRRQMWHGCAASTE